MLLRKPNAMSGTLDPDRQPRLLERAGPDESEVSSNGLGKDAWHGTSTSEGRSREMAGNIDEAKGRAKRAAGELTGDEKLKREGTVDKAAGKAKETVDKAADKGKSLMEND
jgi:uncharacterized protein YjbJ (UPF0337 family)